MSKFTRNLIYVLSAVMVVTSIFIYYLVTSENNALLKKGIRTEATVKDVYKKRPGMKSMKKYFMQVTFLSHVEAVAPDTTAKDILYTIDFSINKPAFNKYKPGDQVKVIYDKDNMAQFRLLEELE